LATQTLIDAIGVEIDGPRRRLRRDRGSLRRRSCLIGHLLRMRGRRFGACGRRLRAGRLSLGLGQLLLGCTGGQP